MVPDVKRGDVAASRTIQTYIRALQQAVTTCPVVQRSLDIITSGLQVPQAHETTRSGDENGSETVHGQNYLPAFPYRDAQANTAETQAGGVDLDAFSFLDCFPENHLDNVTGEWYLPT